MKENFADVPQRWQQVLLGGANFSSQLPSLTKWDEELLWAPAPGRSQKNQPLEHIETTFQGNGI